MRMLYAPNVPNPVRLTAGSDFAFADLIAPALADARAGMTAASPVPVSEPWVRFPLTTPPSTAYRARFDTGADVLVDRFRGRRREVAVATQVEAAHASRDSAPGGRGGRGLSRAPRRAISRRSSVPRSFSPHPALPTQLRAGHGPLGGHTALT